MKRFLTVPVALALVFSACAGSTEPASNVLNVSAQLNAKGYTNDGPATWWWEYDTVQSDLGTANDTEVCGSGTGPRRPIGRCGPATGGSASNQIPLNVVVTGLTPNTTYYFRACGQDTNDPGPTCASTRSFTDAGRHELHVRPQMGQPRFGQRPVRAIRLAIAIDSSSTSMSPTTPTTGSRSSTRRGGSLPSGAARARAMASSPLQRGCRRPDHRQRLRRRHRQQPDPEVQLDGRPSLPSGGRPVAAMSSSPGRPLSPPTPPETCTSSMTKLPYPEVQLVGRVP